MTERRTLMALTPTSQYRMGAAKIVVEASDLPGGRKKKVSGWKLVVLLHSSSSKAHKEADTRKGSANVSGLSITWRSESSSANVKFSEPWPGTACFSAWYKASSKGPDARSLP
eukprot:CAMPEP_0177741568 /NCGR_PEP_ID=MMETSP0484_2-20121128/28180_1 /TAXON_ID=354590 /ORGANISM="Rhodomonas lens, Strain RHODO" /LENGTH=112 /DNA_ID=CAMNT_0019255809 /DNA_START=394 /DNA_END=732 /DNA_ORIENTATION=+